MPQHHALNLTLQRKRHPATCHRDKGDNYSLTHCPFRKGLPKGHPCGVLDLSLLVVLQIPRNQPHRCPHHHHSGPQRERQGGDIIVSPTALHPTRKRHSCATVNRQVAWGFPKGKAPKSVVAHGKSVRNNRSSLPPPDFCTSALLRPKRLRNQHNQRPSELPWNNPPTPLPEMASGREPEGSHREQPQLFQTTGWGAM